MWTLEVTTCPANKQSHCKSNRGFDLLAQETKLLLDASLRGEKVVWTLEVTTCPANNQSESNRGFDLLTLQTKLLQRESSEEKEVV